MGRFQIFQLGLQLAVRSDFSVEMLLVSQVVFPQEALILLQFLNNLLSDFLLLWLGHPFVSLLSLSLIL